MSSHIIRGVRIARPEGIQPGSVHIDSVSGVILAVAGYDEIPREARPIELGKSVLMPGLIQSCANEDDALASGVTTRLGGSEDRPERLDLVQLEHPPAAIARDFLSRQWTAMRERDEAIELCVERFCIEPATALGLDSQKAFIKVGYDADFVVWNPELTVVDSKPLLYGHLRRTIVRGRTVFENNAVVGEPSGRLLRGLSKQG